eukprot:4080528-Pyramimonas_sp.AAC.1
MPQLSGGENSRIQSLTGCRMVKVRAGGSRNWTRACSFFSRAAGCAVFIATHVDDILTGGKGRKYDAFLKYLRSKFPFPMWK